FAQGDVVLLLLGFSACRRAPAVNEARAARHGSVTIHVENYLMSDARIFELALAADGHALPRISKEHPIPVFAATLLQPSNLLVLLRDDVGLVGEFGVFVRVQRVNLLAQRRSLEGS